MDVRKIVNNRVETIEEITKKAPSKTLLLPNIAQDGEQKLSATLDVLANQGASIVKKIDLSQIKSHHQVHGVNSSIRNEIEKYGISRLAMLYDKEFRDVKPTESEIIGYRGRGKSFAEIFNVDFEIIKKANVGDVIIPDTGYSYFAYNQELAEQFTGGAESIMYEVKIPAGSRVSRNLEHGGEILMPRGAKYKLISKDKDFNNMTHVVLEYIPEEIPTEYVIKADLAEEFAEKYFGKYSMSEEECAKFLGEKGVKIV